MSSAGNLPGAAWTLVESMGWRRMFGDLDVVRWISDELNLDTGQDKLEVNFISHWNDIWQQQRAAQQVMWLLSNLKFWVWSHLKFDSNNTIGSFKKMSFLFG